MPVPSFSRLLGRPLPRSSARDERLPSLQALPILSSDALSSVAYSTEAALGILILGGSAALRLSLPIILAIIGLQLARTSLTSLTRADGYPLVVAIGLVGVAVNLGVAFVGGVVAWLAWERWGRAVWDGA